MARAHWMAMLALLVATSSAQAQDDFEDETGEASEDESGGDDFGESEGAEEGDEGAGDGDGGEAKEKDAAPVERNWFFGAYVRGVWVPSFILNVFMDEAPSPFNPAFGAVANFRGETSTFVIGLGYTDYSFDDAIRENGGDANDTEFAESDLALLHVTASILWRTELSEKLEFQYGIGLDFGLVLGEVIRTEAYRDAAGNWVKCNGPNNPPNSTCGPPRMLGASTDPYDVEGEQYGVVEEDIPPVFPMPMLPQLRLRYLIVPELAAQLEASYGIVQFWFGLSVVYGPEM